MQPVMFSFGELLPHVTSRCVDVFGAVFSGLLIFLYGGRLTVLLGWIIVSNVHW